MLAKQKAKEEAAAKQLAEEEALAAKQAEEVTEVKPDYPTVPEFPFQNKYGIQLLTLSKYTEGKLVTFCKKNKLDISKITGNVAGGNFSGKGKMIGKNKSTIFSSFQGNFNLKELGQFLNLEEIESVNGKMVINNNFSGTINPNDGKITISEFNGNTSLTKMNLKLKGFKENLNMNFNYLN